MNHPYKDFEGTKLWQVVDRAVTDLVENQDLEISTPREYVIGYLVKSLAVAGYEPGSLVEPKEQNG